MILRKFYAIAFLLAAASAFGQTTILHDDLESPSTITLNTTDVGSESAGANTWLINNVYSGGNGDIICLGFPLDFSIPATPAQPAGITTANGNYLHVASSEAVNDGIWGSSFAAADGFCIDPGNNFARMSSDVSTTGYSDVTLSFWWICNGGVENYGEVYYSIDGGSSWNLITTPITQYRNQPVWIQQTISLPAFSDQLDLRFGFRFVNNTSLAGGSDPGFAIDDLMITGSTASASLSTGTIAGALCANGNIIMIPYTAIGQFDQGNVFTAELSDPTGSFDQATVIGINESTTSGIINAWIPIGTTGGSGYRIRVTSSAPAMIGTDNGMDVTIDQIPNSGVNSVANVCSADAPFSLIQYLNGMPDIGGTWTMEVAGCYTYSVDGGTCGSSSSTLCITITEAVDAGEDYTGPLCDTGGPILLFPYLGKGAMIGGSWTDAGGPFNGIFIPDVTVNGCYMYTVQGSSPCPSDIATICVTGLIDAPDAGLGSNILVCANTGLYDLSQALEGSPDPAGIWTDQGGDTIVDGMIDTGTFSVGEHQFTYSVTAEPCPNAEAIVTVVVDPCSSIEEQAPMLQLISMDGHGSFSVLSREKISSIEIRNAIGQTIHPASVQYDNDRVMLDLNENTAGIYYFSAWTSAGMHTMRLLLK